MHGIQTSGNCIRNITTEERAGIAVDEIADPRPFCEILRQWSTLHPEFAFLPRKFKVAVNGSREDRAAIGWYDVGLQLVRNEAGELGFKVLVGGGMGRTPIIGTVVREFLPWNQLMNYLEAVIRVYNRYGRRDNAWKARIKILVKAEGQRYIDQVEAEYRQIVEIDGGPHTISQAELDRVAASFVPPTLGARRERRGADANLHEILRSAAQADPEYSRWLRRNVAAHKNPELRAVTLSFKRLGQAPGDATGDQLDIAANLAERFSAGEARTTHEQNLLLPWVHQDDLPELWHAARKAGLAKPNIGLLTDLIACPGGDFCSLANARSLPIAEAITPALPGPGRTARHRRDRPAHQRLHQFVRASPQRPHRHPGRRQGRQGVVPGDAGRGRRIEPVRRGDAGQGGRPVVLRSRSPGSDRGRAGNLPARAPERGRPVRDLHRHPAPRRDRAFQGRRQRRPPHREAGGVMKEFELITSGAQAPAEPLKVLQLANDADPLAAGDRRRRPHRAALPQVQRRPRLQPGHPAAPAAAASRATSAPPATC